MGVARAHSSAHGVAGGAGGDRGALFVWNTQRSQAELVEEQPEELVEEPSTDDLIDEDELDDALICGREQCVVA